MEKKIDAAEQEGSQGTGSAPRNKPKLWVRLVALAAVGLAGWHVLASFLWIAPYSENAREIVPQNALSSYMIPMFGQSWSVFAPEPINGDYHFNVRAIIDDEHGEQIETGWVSATDVELSMIRYNLTPPRAGIQSSELASGYKDAFDGLGDVARTVVQSEFTVDDWEIGLRAALEETVKAEDPDATDEARAAKVQKHLDQEHRATAYATQVARAIWGDNVQSVQIRVSRQNIIPFADRHNEQAVRPEPVIVLPGWRGPIVEPGQNDENFAKVFRGQFERISE